MGMIGIILRAVPLCDPIISDNQFLLCVSPALETAKTRRNSRARRPNRTAIQTGLRLKSLGSLNCNVILGIVGNDFLGHSSTALFARAMKPPS